MNAMIKWALLGAAVGLAVVWVKRQADAKEKYVPEGTDTSNPYWESNGASWYDQWGNYRGITGPR